jgi:ligand-binding sensor domain-containing protein
LPGDSFQIYGQREGLPVERVQTIFEDRQHVLWLKTSSGLCRWSPGSHVDCLNIPSVNVLSLVDEANGGLLIGDDLSGSTLRLSKWSPAARDRSARKCIGSPESHAARP